mmetsp:Transcript_32755/g.86090  ORF Transcript_32755/g.86090 Transcript_32755/m.86090 type:complete len:114 (-) Transcript_32755:834-1175(-)
MMRCAMCMRCGLWRAIWAQVAATRVWLGSGNTPSFPSYILRAPSRTHRASRLASHLGSRLPSSRRSLVWLIGIVRVRRRRPLRLRGERGAKLAELKHEQLPLAKPVSPMERMR